MTEISPNAVVGAQTEDPVLQHLRRHGDHTSMALALNRGVRHHLDPAGRGMVAFGKSGRNLVQICGPFCAAEDRPGVLDAFLDRAAQERHNVTAVQLRRSDAELYAGRGFSVNQLGCSYSIDLSAFTLRGTRFMKARNKISRARRLGITVTESPDRGDDPELSAIDREWLRSKGIHVNELAFLVGERGGAAAAKRRIFVARLALGSRLEKTFRFNHVWSTSGLASPWFVGAVLGLEVLATFYVRNRPFLVARLTVRPDGGLVGLAMRELGARIRVVAIVRGGGGALEHPPRRDTRFAAGDRAYLLGPYEELLLVLAQECDGGET